MGDMRKELIQVNLVIGRFRARTHLLFTTAGPRRGGESDLGLLAGLTRQDRFDIFAHTPCLKTMALSPFSLARKSPRFVTLPVPKEKYHAER